MVMVVLHDEAPIDLIDPDGAFARLDAIGARIPYPVMLRRCLAALKDLEEAGESQPKCSRRH